MVRKKGLDWIGLSFDRAEENPMVAFDSLAAIGAAAAFGTEREVGIGQNKRTLGLAVDGAGIFRRGTASGGIRGRHCFGTRCWQMKNEKK